MPRSFSSGLESMHADFGRLAFAKDAALFEHGVDERRLAVVDVRDDSDVSNIGSGSHNPRSITEKGRERHRGPRD